ncbi:MAG: hypothetical protein EOS41_30725 [Mesorhizobium sp.]|uniref:hypothetical protein n=1 Tax=Mesorhizobium sp. TaxID=1871066 RepID=UPI000FE6A8F0|nr:hypothetical protein [Mesorhizobium sp.]RWE19266.1 MAG: hypothetical protein EOS41_30725 [Mesorhizobium sp.]
MDMFRSQQFLNVEACRPGEVSDCSGPGGPLGAWACHGYSRPAAISSRNNQARTQKPWIADLAALETRVPEAKAGTAKHPAVNQALPTLGVIRLLLTRNVIRRTFVGIFRDVVRRVEVLRMRVSNGHIRAIRNQFMRMGTSGRTHLQQGKGDEREDELRRDPLNFFPLLAHLKIGPLICPLGRVASLASRMRQIEGDAR